MRKLLTQGFLFILVSLGAYIVTFAILYFIPSGGIPMAYRAVKGVIWEGGPSWKKMRDFPEGESFDLIFIGSSHAYRGYDPANFSQAGIKSFNLGTSNQHQMASYSIARQYIKPGTCKMVLIDIYDRVFASDGYESMSDMVINSEHDTQAWDVALRMKDIRAANMLLFRYFNKLSPPLNTDTLDIRNGYQALEKQLSMPGKPKNYRYVSNPTQVKYLEKLIVYLQKQGIRVIMASHPLPTVYVPSDHDVFRRDIEVLMNRYKVPYFDYTDYKPIGGMWYFADESHLNQRGVNTYNATLIRQLQKRGILPVSTHSSSQPDRE